MFVPRNSPPKLQWTSFQLLQSHHSRNLLNQFPTHSTPSLLDATLEKRANRALQPLLWNTYAIAMLIANPSYKHRVSLTLAFGIGG
jgi:hypothetical protein